MPSVSEVAQNDNDDLITAIAALLEPAVAAAAETTFAGREQVALAVTNEAVRRFLERDLQRMADEGGDDIEYEGRSFKKHQLGTAKYHSLCGTLDVRRWTYRVTGMRNGPTIVPLELRAGLIERATPHLGYAVAQGYAKAGSRAIHADLVAAQREPPSRATLERMAKRIAISAKEIVDVIEPEIRAETEVPRETSGISLGLDRTTIPMEEPPSEEEVASGKKVSVHYRMAYVGTIALTDRRGDVLLSWRYAIAAHEDPSLITSRLMNDARHVMQEKARLHVCVVQDGAVELWHLMDNALKKWLPRKNAIHRAIDMFHLCERLSSALEIAFPKKSDADLRAKTLAKWKRALLRRDDAIKDISDFFEVGPRFHRRQHRRMVRDAESKGFFKTRDHYFVDRPDKPRPPPPPPLPPSRFTAQQRAALSTLLDGYLSDPKMFRYASMAKLGLHVGSGVTEGACRSLIAARTKRSGQRWRKPGIAAVLAIRSLAESNRFDPFWSRFAPRYAPLAPVA